MHFVYCFAKVGLIYKWVMLGDGHFYAQLVGLPVCLGNLLF